MTKRDRANIDRYVKHPERRTKAELEVFALFFRIIDRLAENQTIKQKVITP